MPPLGCGAFGESWAYPASYIQLLALAVLLYGTAVYNGSVRVPGCEYPPDQPMVPASPLPVIRASPGLQASPLLKSPLIHGTPGSRATPRGGRMGAIQEMPATGNRGRSGSL